MPSNGRWQTLGKVATAIGVVWALVALGLLGYYASLGIQIVRHGG